MKHRFGTRTAPRASRMGTDAYEGVATPLGREDGTAPREAGSIGWPG
jgi:hypothetical protein